MQIFRNIVRNVFSQLKCNPKPRVIFTQTQHCSSYSVRSHTCGELGLGHVGARVTLAGWLQATRLDKFLLLRDRTGVCQLKLPEAEEWTSFQKLPNESVLVVRGVVQPRPEGQENVNMETGYIEVELEAVEEVSKSLPSLPFQQSKHLQTKEPLRLQYRYLDLRRPDLQYNLAIRSALTMKMREFLTGKKFLDIETPTLFRRTPGGAKEFLVPTRTKDRFYSLVQSPQQFKQLLMVGGLDRYFQVARCYRDEVSCGSDMWMMFQFNLIIMYRVGSLTGSPSSPSSISRCPSRAARTSSAWCRTCWCTAGPAPSSLPSSRCSMTTP